MRMKRTLTRRPTPALIVAIAALVVAMTGVSVAASGLINSGDIKNRGVKGRDLASDAIKGRHIKANKVKAQHIEDDSLESKDIKDETLETADIKDNSLTGKDIAEGSLTSAALADRALLIGEDGKAIRLEATDGTNEDTARAAAPATVAFEKHGLTIYAKCFRDTTADELFAEWYIATSANGAVFNSSADVLDGNPALNTGTPEDRRVLLRTDIDADDSGTDEGTFGAFAADGSYVTGQLTTAAKNGNLPGNNAVYGDGNVCLFGGEVGG